MYPNHVKTQCNLCPDIAMKSHTKIARVNASPIRRATPSSTSSSRTRSPPPTRFRSQSNKIKVYSANSLRLCPHIDKKRHRLKLHIKKIIFYDHCILKLNKHRKFYRNNIASPPYTILPIANTCLH